MCLFVVIHKPKDPLWVNMTSFQTGLLETDQDLLDFGTIC